MGFIQLRLPKRIKHKIENSKRNRQAKANHEEWLQSQGLDNYTLKKKLKRMHSESARPSIDESGPSTPKAKDRVDDEPVQRRNAHCVVGLSGCVLRKRCALACQ